MANWTTSKFSNLIIETNLDQIFVQGKKKESNVYQRLYKVKTTDQWEKKDLTIPNMPLFVKGKEGTNITTFDLSQKYITSYIQDRYEGGYELTWELGKFDMYEVIGTFGQRLMESAYATKAYWAADRFNNQTSVATGYALTDTKALVASDHKLWGGGTASNNAGAVDLGVATLEAALYHYDVLVDDHGNPRCKKIPKLIYAHYSDRAIVTKLLKSVNVPYEFSNTTNATIRDYNLDHIFDEWLSDTDAWGLFPENIELNKCYDSHKADHEVTYEGRTRNKIVTSLMLFRYSFSGWRDTYMGQGG